MPLYLPDMKYVRRLPLCASHQLLWSSQIVVDGDAELMVRSAPGPPAALLRLAAAHVKLDVTAVSPLLPQPFRAFKPCLNSGFGRHHDTFMALPSPGYGFRVSCMRLIW